MESGDLWLAFGHFSGKKKLGVDIGRRIKHALEAAGFAVEWNGSIDRRLLVKGFRWQRRSPGRNTTVQGKPQGGPKVSKAPRKAGESRESKSHPQAVIDALRDGDVKVLEQYLTKENINLVDKDGYSLLSRAATATDVNMKVVRLLIRRGADVNIRLREGWTLLHSAAHLLNKDLASVLLHAGCDPNAVDEAGQTALVKVLWTFNPKQDLIGMLLRHGADPKAKNAEGESALDIATRTDQISLFPSR
jgi:ankyrin repeat protein